MNSAIVSNLSFGMAARLPRLSPLLADSLHWIFRVRDGKTPGIRCARCLDCQGISIDVSGKAAIVSNSKAMSLAGDEYQQEWH